MQRRVADDVGNLKHFLGLVDELGRSGNLQLRFGRGTVTLGGCLVVVGVVWFWDTWDSGERSTFDKFLTRGRVKSMTLLAVE